MFRRLFGWDKPQPEPPQPLYIDPDEQAEIILRDFVNTIVEGLGFWAAMIAIVHKVNNEERLIVSRWAKSSDAPCWRPGSA